MSPVRASIKMTNEGVAFVAVSIVLGMIFSPNIYGISVGVLMLLLVAFEYFRGPIGGVGEDVPR
jgi:hypothetical protein